MAYYSRKHYRLVSPPSDTPQQVLDRQRHLAALAMARQDFEMAYPQVTAENADQAIAYQQERIMFHVGRLGATGGVR